ncbi:hypothetical protein TL16_g07927 [Triparma laevis f. inornata]|uniref:Uncharacterized protein n=1 Tax=Triparma laevis f. inornata TaxID=1714386 RepID=A0A9W7EF04_9STRA|nr:hypothetical protein TL16_g07927 [Triparma laevis f. inornata]
MTYLIMILCYILLASTQATYNLPIIFETPSESDPNSAVESLLLIPINPHDPAPSAKQLSGFLQETQTYAASMELIEDSATARLAARQDACHNSLIWENIPITATNSYKAARSSRSIRSRRGDSALTLRQLRHFDDFFELGKDLGLTGTWAEIGVCQGKQSRKFLDLGPQSQLLMIDAWAAVDVYTAEQGAENLATTIDNVKDYSPKKYQILKMTTAEAAAQIPDASLDFIYLDAGHMYQDVKHDLHAWWPKLKPGGVFAGDDYYNGYVSQAGYTFGVRDAVDEFFSNINHRTYATDYANAEEGIMQQWWVLKCV